MSDTPDLSENRTCLKCRFWDGRSENDAGGSAGYCHRNAPSPTSGIEEKTYTAIMHLAWATLNSLGYDTEKLSIPLESELDRNDYEVTWPRTYHEDHCGEFEKEAR